MNKRFSKFVFRESVTGFLFSLPAILGMIVFFLVPFIICIKLSVVETVSSMKFVGTANYSDVLQSKSFQLAVFNTLKFILVSIPLIMIISFSIALLLHQKLKGSSVFQSIFILPLVLPISSVILFFQLVFSDNGIVNELINNFGIPVRSWLNSDLSFVVLVLLYIWKNVGYNIILFLSALNSISNSYYEAARLDTDSRIKMLRYITIPLIKPYFLFILLISIINTFKSFKEAYILCGDYPNKNIYMIQHFMNNNFQNLNYTRLSVGAILVLGFVFIFILVLFAVRRKRGDQC
ncbi:MAG: sugar ABC transporter permease [Clostridium sp.]|nr:sugar ABC transporter permease [Clostridium sp.]MCM1546930.1 sugar ABC transporter permease [Ruminococcus sp.]